MYMYGKRMKELVLVTFVSELNIKLDHEWERKQERLGRKKKILNIGEDRKPIEIYNKTAVACMSSALLKLEAVNLGIPVI